MIFDIYLNGLRGSGLPIGAVVTVVQAVSGHRVVTAKCSEYLQKYGAESQFDPFFIGSCDTGVSWQMTPNKRSPCFAQPSCKVIPNIDVEVSATCTGR